MRLRKILVPSLALGAAFALAAAAAAQPPVTLPRVSPHAVVTQTIGLTEITVDYHRPAVNDRQIWGGLVPYGQVWRAGANENTTVSFGDDVEVEGKALPAGTYGLHTIPGEDEWTVIFSNNYTSWGSFSYDEAEDAARVTVKPQQIPHTEHLTYRFVDPAADSVVLALDWEKVRVPIEVSVDSHAVVLASIRNELRSLPGFSWQGPASAAAYILAVEKDVDQGLAWADQSISMQATFTNLQTKAGLLRLQGDEEEAGALMAQALDLATPIQVHGYARQLVAQGKAEEAMEVFRKNAETNPEVWFIDVGLARGYSALGQLDKAAEHMRQAVSKAPDAQRPAMEGLLQQLENGVAIN